MVQRLDVYSPAFANGAMIPEEFTCDGRDVKPPLGIDGAPPEARTFAVIMEDPDSPHGTWVHWLLWDLPVTHRSWAAATDLTIFGAVEGQTSWADRPPGYHGPCPGTGTHRYFFEVFAIDTILGLPMGTDRGTLERAMQGRVVGKGMLMGRYIRRANRQNTSGDSVSTTSSRS